MPLLNRSIEIPHSAAFFLTAENIINSLPDELLLNIFKNLSAEDLGRTSRVCKEWNVIVFDEFLIRNDELKELFPSLKIIDAKIWKKHTNFPEKIKEFPLHRKNIPLIKGLLSSLKTEGGLGITLLTMPQGLTYGSFETFALYPQNGCSSEIRYTHSGLKSFRDVPINKTHRVIITNAIIDESRSLSREEGEKKIKNLGCQLPNFLHAFVLMSLTCMSSSSIEPIRLYSDKPATMTHCAEKVGEKNVVIGTFNESGLAIMLDTPQAGYLGVGAMYQIGDKTYDN